MKPSPHPSVRLRVLAILVLLSGAVWACRFNVRDVGFVALDDRPYELLCFVGDTVAGETRITMEDVGGAAFLDANVEAKVVALNGDGSPESEADNTRHYQEAGSPAPPAAVLVSPDGKRHLALPLLGTSEPVEDSLWRTMESITDSAVREDVLEKAMTTYGVVLVVEGPDAGENKRVRQAAIEVIGRIAASLPKLEKEIAKPPELVVLPESGVAKETVFLWSLGIPTRKIAEPHVAVLYGRGRRIGEILAGSAIHEKSLFAILSTIGLNCECGLDRSWMQGERVPMKWTEDDQIKLAGLLGFDAEDPRIKMEMSQILAKGAQARGSRNGAASRNPAFALTAYKEISVGAGDEIVEAQASSNEDGATGEIPGMRSADPVSDVPSSPQKSALHWAAYLLVVCLALLVVLAGIVIFWRGRSGEA